MILRTISLLLVSVVTAACVADTTSQSTATQSTSAPKATSRRGRQSGAQQAASRLTAVVVEDIHCKHCGKRLARKLFAVPGVVRVRADVANNLAIVTPQENKPVAASLLWEAAEAAGFKVVEIDGPEGEFTKKPVARATARTAREAAGEPAPSAGRTGPAR